MLGVGCERGVSLEALEDGLRQVLGRHGFALASIGTLASADLKSDEAAIVALAERHGWQTVFFTPEELARSGGNRQSFGRGAGLRRHARSRRAGGPVGGGNRSLC